MPGWTLEDVWSLEPHVYDAVVDWINETAKDK